MFGQEQQQKQKSELGSGFTQEQKLLLDYMKQHNHGLEARVQKVKKTYENMVKSYVVISN